MVRQTAGIILAAGDSSRMGKNKMLLPVSKKTLLEWCIAGMSRVCGDICVVVGNNPGQFDRLIQHYRNVRFVINNDYRQGMFSSVRKGLSEQPGRDVLILPGDCPFVKSDTYRVVAMAGEKRAVPIHKRQPGHPVFLDHESVELLLKSDCQSLRDFLHIYGYNRIPVDDHAVLDDIDTISDYREALRVYDLSFNRPSK